MRQSKRKQTMLTRQPGHQHYGWPVLLIVLLVIALSACQPAGDPPASTSPVEGASQQPAEEESDANTIQADWESSPHAETYVVDANDENNTCARCHAPVNWVPSMDDLPSACFSCKFEIKDPPPFIAETDWTPIECKVCHEVDRNNNVAPEFKWLEIAAIDEYADVESASALCQKCHIGADLPDHMPVEVAGVHETLLCTECHDAHSTSSSCTAAGCHDDWQAGDPPIVGHDSDHENVSCVACHDGGDLDVGPEENASEQWLTFVSYTMDGETTSAPFTSHNIQLEVSCERCHFAGNPWALSTDVETASGS